MVHSSRFAIVFKVTITLMVMLLVLGSTAQAQVSQGDTPSGRGGWQAPEAGTTYPEDEPLDASAYLQTAGSALRAENTVGVESSVRNGRFGCLYAVNGIASSFFSAPIYPPQGATLTMLRAYVYDMSGLNGLVAFSVVDEFGYEILGWFGTSAGISGDGTFDISIPNHVVDYSKYSYQLVWQSNQLGDTMMICGLRLYYLPQGGFVHLPAVMKEP